MKHISRRSCSSGSLVLLAGFVAQLQGCCTIVRKHWQAAFPKSATRGAAEIADYLLLQVCNRYEPLMTHLAAAAGQIHPESLYRVLLEPGGRTRDIHREPQASASVSAVPA